MFVGFSIFDSVSCLLKFIFLCNKIHPHGNTYTFCLQKIVQDVYNRCIQNVYKIKRTMPAQFCIHNEYKSLSKCEIHLDTFCIKKFVEMWDTFCIQSNLCITTTWGTKFLQLLQTGGRYEEDLCITAKTANSDIWSLYKGSIIFHLITHDTVKNKSACVFVRNQKLL